jgi:hypothetical protein
MSRCSRLYLTTVLLLHEDLVKAVGLSHLLYAAACKAAGSDFLAETERSPTQSEYPNWLLQARPASSMRQLVIDWCIELQDIKSQFEKLVAAGERDQLHSESYIWQGSNCYLCLEVTEDKAQMSSACTAPAKKIAIGCSVHPSGGGDQLCRLNSRYVLLRAGSERAEDAVQTARVDCYTGQGNIWGEPKFVFDGCVSTWQEVEQRLRADQVVHDDSYIHIRVVIKNWHELLLLDPSWGYVLCCKVVSSAAC